MKLTTFLILGLAIGQLSALHLRPKRCKKKGKWGNISVSSSGTSSLKNATDGGSYTSNQNVDNLLMTNAHTGTTVNHHKKRENSRLIGGDVTSIETSGNNEIDIGGAALLKKAGRGRRHKHRHGRHYHRPCYYPGPTYGPWGYGGYGGAYAHAHAGANAWGSGPYGGANAYAHAHARSNRWGGYGPYGPYGGASANARANANAWGRGGRANAHAHARSKGPVWGPYGGRANAHAHAKAKANSAGGKSSAKANAKAGANTWGGPVWGGRGSSSASAKANARANGGRASASAHAKAHAHGRSYPYYLGSDQ